MFEDLFGKKKEEKEEKKPAIQIGVGPAVPTAPAGPMTTETGKDIATEVEDVRKDVDKIKDSINALRGSLKSVTEKIDSIEKNLGQLTSLYEVIMNQMNPFLDEDERAVARQKKAEEVMEAPSPVEEVKAAVPEGVVLGYIDVANPKVIQHVLDWMQFLIERVGHEGIEDILRYYVEIRWISEDVAEILKRYAEGIKVENEPVAGTPVQLDPEDHMKCLDYIMQIKEVQ